MFLISDSPLISCNLEIAFNLKKIVVMCWEWSGSLGGGGGGVAGSGNVMPMPLVVEVIYAFRGKNDRGLFSLSRYR